jgi:phenol hydroxylase P1 protein
MVAYEIKQNVIDPLRTGFSWVESRLGRPANRYEEASIEVQQEENFHYRPVWDPDHEIFDRNYTRLDLGDPYKFTDPRQYYYFTYNQARSRAAERFGEQLDYAARVGAFAALPAAWQTAIATVVAPLRHFEYGLQLVLVQVSGFSWGTTIEQAACFSAFDHLGNAQLSSRIVLGLDNGIELLGRARELWLQASWLQPARKFVENVLVEPDWADQFIAVQLALAPRFYPAVWGGLERAAVKEGQGLLAGLFHHFVEWYEDDQRWSRALAAHLVSVNDTENRHEILATVDRFRNPSEALVEALAGALAEVIDVSDSLAAGERAAAETLSVLGQSELSSIK